MGRDFERSLVQLPAASGLVSYKFRVGCSGIYPAGSRKPQRLDSDILSGQYVLIPDSPHGE